MAQRPVRASIGFQGGQVLAVRIAAEALETLRAHLSGGGWHELATDEGIAHVNLGEVVYLNVDSDEHRVGFGR